VNITTNNIELLQPFSFHAFKLFQLHQYETWNVYLEILKMRRRRRRRCGNQQQQETGLAIAVGQDSSKQSKPAEQIYRKRWSYSWREGSQMEQHTVWWKQNSRQSNSEIYQMQQNTNNNLDWNLEEGTLPNVLTIDELQTNKTKFLIS